MEERKDREGKGTKYLRKEKYLEYRGTETICDRNWDLDKYVEIVGIISIAGVPCTKKIMLQEREYAVSMLLRMFVHRTDKEAELRST